MELSRVEHRELLRALSLNETIPFALADRAEQHIRSCPKCQLVLKRTRHLHERLNNILSASHPDSEALVNYVTANRSAHLQDDQFSSFQQIETHVKACSLCQMRVQHLQDEINQVEQIIQSVEEEFSLENDFKPDSTSRPIAGNLKSRYLPTLPKVVFPVAGLCVGLLLLFFVSLSTQPLHYDLAQVNTDQYDVLPTERGLSEEEVNLLSAEDLINSGAHDQARQRLQLVNVQGLSQAQALRFHLCDLMLTLKSAHRSFLSLFPHFDQEAVRKSLQQMEASLNNAPADTPQKDAYWGLAHYYSAKACLMLNDQNAAIAHLRNSRTAAHLRLREAEQLLQALTTL